MEVAPYFPDPCLGSPERQSGSNLLAAKLCLLEEALVVNRVNKYLLSTLFSTCFPFAPLQSLGLSRAAASMFGSDGGELILHFVTQCNSKLRNLLEEEQKLIQLGQTE